MVLIFGFVSCSSETEISPADDPFADDEIAMRDRNANLPTLFDYNQAENRDDRNRSSKFSDPNAYDGRPGR
jgi:hypothetical protein